MAGGRKVFIPGGQLRCRRNDVLFFTLVNKVRTGRTLRGITPGSGFKEVSKAPRKRQQKNFPEKLHFLLDWVTSVPITALYWV
jgi:hypothetical protein